MTIKLSLDEFTIRLKNILSIRKQLTRKELLHVLNTFWKFNKSILEVSSQSLAYSKVRAVLQKFDTVILESNYRYFYVRKHILVGAVP